MLRRRVESGRVSQDATMQVTREDRREAKAARRAERKAAWMREKEARKDEAREQGQTFRSDVERSAEWLAFRKAKAEPQCRRCGITREEHLQIKRGPLEKHHVVPIVQGGHPSDPSNMLTLCYFCHKEWHTWWERSSDWPAYMAAEPFRLTVMRVCPRVDPMPTEGCQRCGILAEACRELHPHRQGLKPFERARGERDFSKCVCYWCQREWEVFWQFLRHDESGFFCTRALDHRA